MAIEPGMDAECSSDNQYSDNNEMFHVIFTCRQRLKQYLTIANIYKYFVYIINDIIILEFWYLEKFGIISLLIDQA